MGGTLGLGFRLSEVVRIGVRSSPAKPGERPRSPIELTSLEGGRGRPPELRPRGSFCYFFAAAFFFAGAFFFGAFPGAFSGGYSGNVPSVVSV